MVMVHESELREAKGGTRVRTRILVVDDTIFYRKVVGDIVGSLPEAELVGTASNGKIALSRIRELRPDLITLDIEMPEMNGLEVLEALRKESLDTGVIVLSSLTLKGGELTMRALELGAFDFITKPEGGSMEASRATIEKGLIPLLRAFTRHREIRSILKGGGQRSALATPARPGSGKAMLSAATRMDAIARGTGAARSEVVGIGISTGGPNALLAMLPQLPPDLGVPVLVVQHMPPMFTHSLAASLNSKCGLSVKEAENGESVEKNTVYIAPGGRQMKVTLGTDATKKILRVTDDPPENNCKPSVDYLFRSLAHHYLGRSTGVIMTGMGNDGTVGLKLMKRNGSVVIAQDEATSVVFGMPKEAIDAGVVDTVAPLDRIAEEIVRTVR